MSTPLSRSSGPQESGFSDHAAPDPVTPPGGPVAPPAARSDSLPDDSPPPVPRRLLGAEIGILVGGATNPDPTLLGPGFQNGSTELGFAFGARAGIVLRKHLYLGFQFVDYTGGTRYIVTDTPNDSWKAHALQEGGDLGWGITWRLLTVRPQLGLGNITFGGPPWATPADFLTHRFPGHSSSSLYIQPGVAALVGPGPLYVGADVSYLDITKHAEPEVGTNLVSAHAWTAHVQLGLRL